MYRFNHLPEYKLKALVLQAIRLKECCDSVLLQKNKSYNFIIDHFLSGKFWIPQKHSDFFLPIVGSWHYWIPTIRQIKSIFKELDIFLSYHRLPEYKPATHHHTVTCADPWPEHPWERPIWAQGFFMEYAYVECLIIFCKRHPGEVETAISRIVNKAKAL